MSLLQTQTFRNSSYIRGNRQRPTRNVHFQKTIDYKIISKTNKQITKYMNREMKEPSLDSVQLQKTEHSSHKTKTEICNEKDKDEVFTELLTLKRLKLPATLRKNYGETARIINNLLNSPVLSKSSIMCEIKCFMSNSFGHDSHLLNKKLVLKAKEKLKLRQKDEPQQFKYDYFSFLIKKIEERASDSDELLQTFQTFLTAYQYPISVQLMAHYMGIFLYSINARYSSAELMAKQLMDLILKHRLEQYIPIYLIMMVKLKVNLFQWEQAIQLTSKTLAAAWAFRLQDLEIWCYFQLSRANFFLGNSEASHFFKIRSEMSILEPESLFRQMSENEYKREVQLMRNNHYHFNFQNIVTHQHLTALPPTKPSASLKLQIYAKNIAQNFKIQHVKNLQQRIAEDCSAEQHQAGNPLFRTHQSGIKNLNIYFRQSGKDSQNMYTFENSVRNSLILRQMGRNILIEMKWFPTEQP